MGEMRGTFMHNLECLWTRLDLVGTNSSDATKYLQGEQCLTEL
jgi:hypothetical protein